ncbi:gamma-glutamyltransferase [Halalkalibaculum roseum]|uniref:gamma-glutamyltransferase n=1 Tax=Halalkalibaculum roseum TaxID=2709311 RepID=UPI002012D598|nr:gamma-glutamyltransferase [Halalkalibaculum roseum]
MKLLIRFLFVVILFLYSGLQNPAISQVGWTKAYENAAVVTAESHASKAGKQILSEGGNAVDAAVAVQFALAVTLPRAGNIGGGGFMVIQKADGTSISLDFREKAPLKSSRDMYIRNGELVPELSREGALAVGVPGVVDGMIKALERYGNLPLETVMKPAIKLASEGYRLSWVQAEDLNAHAEDFRNYDSSSGYFTKPSGEQFEEGDLFVQKDLAKTLRRISTMGRKGFYSGKTADLIVGEMQKLGGLITYKDLNEYESVWRKTVKAHYQDYELAIMPPPSSGSIAIAQIMKMLDSYDLKELGFNSADYIHLITETMRRAFADRAYFLGDPDFVDIPGDTLLSDAYNENRMETFNWDASTPSRELDHGDIPTFQYSESSETTHFSIVDAEGSAVAVTTTLNGSFGSHVSVGGAGFLLNNEMDDFTAKPGEPNMFGLIQGEANAVQPGKRMLSSMSPTIVTKDGKVRMVLGAAGGPRIITATFMSFLNMAVFGMNAREAISAPRFHHQWMPDKLYYEAFGISPDTRELLEAKGHELEMRPTVGRGHIIYVDENNRRHGAADPRGNGTVEGY